MSVCDIFLCLDVGNKSCKNKLKGLKRRIKLKEKKKRRKKCSVRGMRGKEGKRKEKW